MSPFIEPKDLPWHDLGGGVQRKIVCHTPQIMAVMVRFDRDAVGAVHHHDVHDQVSYVVRGSFEVSVGPEKRLLSAGEFFQAEHPAPHGVRALEPDSVLLDVFSPRRDDFL